MRTCTPGLSGRVWSACAAALRYKKARGVGPERAAGSYVHPCTAPARAALALGTNSSRAAASLMWLHLPAADDGNLPCAANVSAAVCREWSRLLAPVA